MSKKVLFIFFLGLISFISTYSFANEDSVKANNEDTSIKRVLDAKILKVGADPNMGMPYIKQQSRNDYRGFEIDISKYIAEQIGCSAKIVPTNWENLIKNLELKKYDIAIGSIEKPEKKNLKYENIIFSEPYYKNSFHIVTNKDNKDIRILSDLKNKKVGVLENSFGEILVNQINIQKKYNVSIIKYNNIDDLFKELQKKTINSLIIDTPIATWKCENDNIDCKKVGISIYSKDYVIAVRKEDKALLNNIDKIILEAKKKKVLTDILGKWNID